MYKSSNKQTQSLSNYILNSKNFVIILISVKIFYVLLRSIWESTTLPCMDYTTTDPAGIYLFKVNNRNTRTRREICSKLTIKTPEQCHWLCSGVFIVNFEHISCLVLVFLLLTLNR